MIFHRKKSESCSPILMFGEPLVRVQSTKFLGVIFDKNLSWKCHTKDTTRRLSKFIPVLPKLKGNCSKKIVKEFHNCLVYSNIIYFNTALAPLQVTQRKILRTMAGLIYISHTGPVFKVWSLLSIRNLNRYMTKIFVHKSLSNAAFQNWFTLRSHRI